ncbi:MAG: RluA family pseudouridine synthase [Deltaproteobacteria bacterium]|nr:RluA family pseudouridine synthase [Deltaproteobacteria bacterium]
MEPRQFIVASGEKGARLDRWLTQKMPQLSRGQIKHLIDHGRVLINHRRVLIAGWELESADNIEVRMPVGGLPEIQEVEEKPQTRDGSARGELPSRPSPSSRSTAGEQAARQAPVKPSHRFLDVLFEDRDIIVVDKPAGVLTEPKGGSPHDSLLAMMKGYLKRKFKESRGSYVKLLHRLDRDTSGVVVAAKSKVGEQLEDQFKNHTVDRKYIAIVEGAVEKEEGLIDFPLEKGDFKGGRKAQVVKKGQGLPARTRFRVEERYKNATLLAIQVETGRTHQVRIHMAEIGHPLVGDRTYGPLSGGIPFSRHALHAASLGFKNPRNGRKEKFESKLPDDMVKLIDRLRGGDEKGR